MYFTYQNTRANIYVHMISTFNYQSKSEENSAKLSQKCHKLDTHIKELEEELSKKPKTVERVRAATPPPPPSPPPPGNSQTYMLSV